MHTKYQDDDYLQCRKALRRGSSTFYSASRLLPPTITRSITALYAFCRVADDKVDAGIGSDTAVRELDERLQAIYRGHPQSYAEDRLLAGVIRKYQIPKLVFDFMLEGFCWDAHGRSYGSVYELEEYAVRVASTVGVAMAILMGCRERAQLARAADLGIAMQLTNICRDVGEDARNGRLYLPHDLLQQEGLDVEQFRSNPVMSEQLARVIARLLEHAELYYQRGYAGAAVLPVHYRHAIYAAGLIYREIGVVLAQQQHDAVNQRAWVPTRRKLSLLAQSLLPVPKDADQQQKPTSSAAVFLVDGCAARRERTRYEAGWGRALELLILDRQRRLAAARRTKR